MRVRARALPRVVKCHEWHAALAAMPLAIAAFDSAPYILATVARVMVPAVADAVFIDRLERGEVRREHAYTEQLDAEIEDDAAAIEAVLRSGEHHLSGNTLVVAIPSAGTPRAMTLVSSVPFGPGDLAQANVLSQWLALALSTLVRDVAGSVDAVHAAVVHDLMNPLTVITVNAHRIRTSHGEDLDHRLALIERAARRVHDLSTDLLDDVRRSTDRVALDLGWTYVTDLIGEATEAVRDAAIVKDIGLIADEHDGLVLCDRARLVQVLVNLLDNAVKFTDPGGLISVETARIGERVRITIADSGRGIAPQDLPRIFDRYWRSAGGTGIGLATARSLLAAHDSELHVTSVLGCGTTFWFDLHAAV